MTTQITTSKQFALNWQDLLKGFLVAVLSPVFTIMYGSLSAGSLVFEWKAIITTGMSAALGYLLKNFLTPPVTTIVPAPTEPTVVVPPSKN